MDAREIRFAVIGTGFGAKMIPIIQQVPGCTVAAVVGRNEATCAEVATKYGIRHNTHLEAVLSDPDIDAVYIATPNDTHAAIAILAAEHGKHVIVEKPMAKTTADCDRMIEACKRHNVRLMPAYMLRFHPRYGDIRDMIAEDTLGDIVYARIQCAFWYPSNGTWRQEKKSEGPLWDLASHAVDLVHSLFRQCAQSVQCKTQRRIHDYPADDTVLITLELDDGAPVTIDISFAVPHSEGCLEIYGTRASLIGVNAISQDGLGEVRLLGEDVKIYPRLSFDQYGAMFAHFAECVRQGREPTIVTPQDGSYATRTLEAACESAKSGYAILI